MGGSWPSFFDIGYSRALAWARRPQAAALVARLADPDRGWEAIVIGEYERAFYGSQYAAMAPLFEHYGVQLWTPEVGGCIDFGAEDHEQAMLVLGVQSKREIARTRIRVRTEIAAQTREQGRYLGGRPPYGYRLADAGPHPSRVGHEAAGSGYFLKALADQLICQVGGQLRAQGIMACAVRGRPGLRRGYAQRRLTRSACQRSQSTRGHDQAQLAKVPAGQQPGQHGQDRPIGPGQPRSPDLALKHGDLLASRRISASLAWSERASRASQPKTRRATR